VPLLHMSEARLRIAVEATFLCKTSSVATFLYRKMETAYSSETLNKTTQCHNLKDHNLDYTN
jgi:hypothetical protein